MNQCDGCRQGNKPDSKGFHRDDKGHAFMVCQAHKYESTKEEWTWEKTFEAFEKYFGPSD